MPESVYDKKARVRAPRVHITYETELGGAMRMKELPFVLGVMSDLSGHPREPLEKLKDAGRKFVAIDRDNFDDVLRSIKPRLALRVQNQLAGDDSELAVELEFEKLADFAPDRVAAQVEPLQKLLEARGKLRDLLSRMEGNDRLEELLAAVTGDEAVKEKLRTALAAAAGGEAKKES